jgi:hypothetical protein
VRPQGRGRKLRRGFHELGRDRFAVASALVGAIVVGGLVDTPAAHAAITGSQLTTPGNPSFFIADQDASAQTFAISGTTSGGNAAADKVNIRCYYASTFATVASNVALQSNGSFSVPSADLNAILNTTCRPSAAERTTWISDLFTSTDAKAHSVDPLWDNGQHFYGASGDSSQIGRRELRPAAPASSRASRARRSRPQSARSRRRSAPWAR